MTKEEVENRVNAINTIIESQAKLEKMKSDADDAVYEMYKRRPKNIDEFDDLEKVDAALKADKIAQDNTIIINDRINQGASFEEIADLIQNGYVDENGEKHTFDFIDITDIDFLNIKGIETELREDLMAYYYTDGGNYYTEFRDTSAVLSRFAEEAAYKGMSPDELPAELLFDMLFVKYFIDAKAQTKEIKKDYKSSLIDFLNGLKKKEHIETGVDKKKTKTDRSKHEMTAEENIGKVEAKITVSDLAQAFKAYGIAEEEQGQVADIITKERDDGKEIIDE